MNTYNHIYGLSISGLQFFTIYAPGLRPNMTYFSFTPDILNGETHRHIYQGANNKDLTHDFTSIDDLSELVVLHLLMWWTNTQVVEGGRQSCVALHF